MPIDSSAYCGRAVVVGANISNLPDLPVLDAAFQDAAALAQTITDGQSTVFLSRDVSLLTGQNATMSNILRSISAVPRRRFNLLLVYYSGHAIDGHASGAPKVLATYAEQPAGPRLSMPRLMETVKGQAARYDSVVTILDCCYSGTVSDILRVQYRLASPSASDLGSLPSNMVAMMSCRAEEVSTAGMTSVFTSALISAMRATVPDDNGGVAALEVFNNAAKRTTNANEHQHPVIVGAPMGLDLYLARSPRSRAPATLSAPQPLSDVRNKVAIDPLAGASALLQII